MPTESKRRTPAKAPEKKEESARAPIPKEIPGAGKVSKELEVQTVSATKDGTITGLRPGVTYAVVELGRDTEVSVPPETLVADGKVRKSVAFVGVVDKKD